MFIHNYNIIYLLILDRNNWNHITLCKLFSVNYNTWYHIIIKMSKEISTQKCKYERDSLTSERQITLDDLVWRENQLINQEKHEESFIYSMKKISNMEKFIKKDRSRFFLCFSWHINFRGLFNPNDIFVEQQ